MLTGSLRLLLDSLAALTYVAAGLSRGHNGHSHLTCPPPHNGGCTLIWVLRRAPVYSICVSSKHKADRRRRYRDALDSIQTTIIGR